MEDKQPDNHVLDTLARMEREGKKILIHRPFMWYPGERRTKIAKQLSDIIEKELNIIASPNQYRQMLEEINPDVTCYTMTGFNIDQEKELTAEGIYIHDTVDLRIKNAIGHSLEHLFQKLN